MKNEPTKMLIARQVRHRSGIMLAILFCCIGGRGGAEPPAALSGNAVIRARFGASDIVITATDRLAGAIHSLTWNGREFIDSLDHGRQLQSACSFDNGAAGEFWAECFNPTEAGSRADGAGPRSTSKLIKLKVDKVELQTTSQMAFWLIPGEKSAGRPALNTTALSNHLLTKRVRIGHEKLENVIEYDVTFAVPQNERHHYAQFEALTGYMPSEFERFWTFHTATGQLLELDDGPGEQQYPVVFSNRTASHAMGIYSPDQPSVGYEQAGYGRFRFPQEKVVKWNCVFRTRNADGIKPGEYCYRLFVVVGDLRTVQQTLTTLTAKDRQP